MIRSNDQPLSARLRWLAAFSVLLLSGCVSSPPVQEMSDARQAIAAAIAADAERLAPESLNAARRFLGQAERQLLEESYGPARMNAVRARNRAIAALDVIQSAEQARD